MQTTASLWENLCRDLVGEHDDLPAIRRFLEAAGRVLRPDSIRLSEAYEIAGDRFQAAEEWEEALLAFRAAHDRATKADSLAAKARIAVKLALVCERLSEVSQALQSAGEALSHYEEMRDMSQHVMLLNLLGGLCRQQGNPQQAAEYHQKAFELARDLYSSNHPETATALNNLGVAKMEAQDYVEAENLHMQALGIREKCYGGMHPEVAQSMANLGAAYHCMGQYDRAEAFYTGADQIYRSFVAEGDPELTNLEENRAALAKARTKPK